MGNILQDMMGLLSRKKVVTESEPTDFILLGRTPNPEDSMFVTPKMNNQLITIKDLKAQFDAGEISGGGTVNTIPLFTPDGTTLGDSIMRQTSLTPTTYALDVGNSRITEVSLASDTVSATSIYATNVQGLNGGTAIFNGTVQIGNEATDVLLVNSETEFNGNVVFDPPGYVELRGAVADNTGSPGTAGQILSSTSTGVQWIEASDTLAEVLTNGNTTDGSNINFADGDKAIFGAGTDLQIYHDGSNSYIADAGTGDLIISATNFQVNDTATGERFISAHSNGDVKLYFDSKLKLATVTDGVSITGKVTDLTDPTDPQDAATKAYVDAQSGGLTQTTGTVTPTLTAGISGLTYLIQTGYWTRIGDIVNVYINVNIGTFTKTDPNIRLTIDDVFPYDIDSFRFFFNSDIMRYTNISNSGTAIPALYVLEPSTTGSYPYSIFFGQSSNYSLGSGNFIITDNMSTGGFDLVFSFTYKATGNTLRAGATID